MKYFRKILRFARPYQRYAWLNVVFNILYAIFNVLSILTFIPVLGILFGREEKVTTKPRGLRIVFRVPRFRMEPQGLESNHA